MVRSVPSKESLSDSRYNLFELINWIYFGRITDLTIRGGDPDPNASLGIIRETKFGSEHGPRLEYGATNFLLKRQAVELLVYFDELQDGTIDVLEIKHGLPFRAIVTETLAITPG